MKIKEVIEKIKENLTKEKLTVYWLWLWGKEPEPVDESIFEDPDRYVKLDDKDGGYWEDLARFKRQKRDLGIRRFFVCLGVVFIVIVSMVILRWTVIESVRHAIAGNRFLMCMGKEVCIYEGPRMNYYMRSPVSIMLDNNNLFVFTDSKHNYDSYKHKIQVIINSIPFANRRSTFKIRPLFYKAQLYDIIISDSIKRDPAHVAEIYDIKKNRFFNLNNISGNDLNFEDVHLAKNILGDIILISPNSPVVVYDVKQKKFRTTQCNIFNTVIQHPSTYIYYVNQYDQNRAIVFAGDSGKSRLPYYFIGTGLTRGYHLKSASLYFMDLTTFEISKMPDFAKKPKYFPLPNEYIFLKNGKIIIPIFSIKKKNNRRIQVWDHIEIYDPVKNKFFVETNTNVMDENIFQIEKENGDILFINRSSTYIFKNATNSFEKASSSEIAKNKKTIEKLDKLTKKLLKETLNSSQDWNILIQKISSPNKFILYSSKSKKTIFYDYTKNKVKTGPSFPAFYEFQGIPVNIDNKTVIFLGARNYDRTKLDILGTYIDIPSKYTQILYVKD